MSLMLEVKGVQTNNFGLLKETCDWGRICVAAGTCCQLLGWCGLPIPHDPLSLLFLACYWCLLVDKEYSLDNRCGPTTRHGSLDGCYWRALCWQGPPCPSPLDAAPEPLDTVCPCLTPSTAAGHAPTAVDVHQGALDATEGGG